MFFAAWFIASLVAAALWHVWRETGDVWLVATLAGGFAFTVLILSACSADRLDQDVVSGPPVTEPRIEYEPMAINDGVRAALATTTTTTVAPRRPHSHAGTVNRAPAGCGGWRDTVAALWPASDVDRVCRVLMCESDGDPHAEHRTSHASGLMQVMPFWADRFEAVTGAAYYDGRFDPVANLTFAAWLWREGGPSHWVCK